MLHLFHNQGDGMFEDEDYERYGIYDLSDVLTDEEIETIRQSKEDEHFNAPTSMESLGLSWRDFF